MSLRVSIGCGHRLTRPNLDHVRRPAPDFGTIVQHNHHGAVRREKPLDVFLHMGAVLVPAKDPPGKVLAGGVDGFGHRLGIGAGSHGVDVKLVKLKHDLEETD